MFALYSAVYTLGNNAMGQCGRAIVEGETYKASRVTHVIERTDIVKVVCGHDHTLMLTNDGKVLGCGLGADGQTGNSASFCLFVRTFICKIFHIILSW